MPWTLRRTSPESLVRQFVSVTRALCLQLRRGLREGPGLDPIQVIIAGCLSRRIGQGGEINGVKYWKHGFGAMLRDAKRPPDIAGTVNIDVHFGELDRPAAYIFNTGDIDIFARSLNRPEPSVSLIEGACFRLVRARVLRGPTTPSTDPVTRWSHNHWSFKPNVGDMPEPQIDVGAKRETLRLAVEGLGPPRDMAFKWEYAPFEDE